MIIFLIIAVVGLIFSIIAHIGSYYGYDLDLLLMCFSLYDMKFSVLGIGLFILTPFLGICSEATVSKKYNKEIRKRAFADSGPRWVWVVGISCLIYGVFAIAYFCTSALLACSDIKYIGLIEGKLEIGITSVYFAVYVTAIPFYFYYKTLRKMIKKENNVFPNSE